MSNEIGHNYTTGMTLYSCRFKVDGEVFVSNGSSSETWGASGHTADDYDVSMTEQGSSGHYVGDFDPSANIDDGDYRFAVYLQAGANPADSDKAIAQGIVQWRLSEALNIRTALNTVKDKLDHNWGPWR